MSGDDLARKQAESQRESLADYWAAVDHVDDCPDGDPEACPVCAAIAAEYGADRDELATYLNEMPLEIVWEVGEPFAVVLGTGGPHVEITGGGRWSGSGYTLEVYWGGDHVTLRGEAINRTGEYFRELVEETS